MSSRRRPDESDADWAKRQEAARKEVNSHLLVFIHGALQALTAIGLLQVGNCVPAHVKGWAGVGHALFVGLYAVVLLHLGSCIAAKMCSFRRGSLQQACGIFLGSGVAYDFVGRQLTVWCALFCAVCCVVCSCTPSSPVQLVC